MAMGMAGIKPTMILTNPLMAQHIIDLYENGNYTQEQQINKYKYNTIPTPYGRLEVMGDPHIAVSHDGGTNYSTTVYVLTERHKGEDILYMDYLIPETVLPSGVFNDGSACTSIMMGMYAVGTLVSRANIAQAKFINAGFNAAEAQASKIVTLSLKRI
jgi:hypothetical protein